MKQILFALGMFITVGAMIASGEPTLLLDDITGGTLNEVIPNGDAQDSSAVGGSGITGVVQFSGTVGNWTVSNAVGNPFLSTTTVPNVAMGTTTVKNNSGMGTFVVAFADLFDGSNAFTAGAPYLRITITPSLASKGTVDFYAESGTTPLVLTEGGGSEIGTVGPGPFLFSGGTNLFSQTGVTTTAFSQLVVAPMSNYSLGLVAVIKAAQGMETEFNFRVQAVPEPGFYGLLALGLSILYYFGIRRKRHQNRIARTP
jgi:hypothetical protein